MPQHETRRDLAGKVALVTGSAINIGSTIARELGSSGAAVAVNYRSSEDGALETVAAIEAAGGKAVAVQADITRPQDVARLFETIDASFGGLDILVNNANVRSYRALGDLTLEEFNYIVTTTLSGCFLCVQAAVPLMRTRGGGTIVNIGGGSGHTGVAGRTHVAAAKAGLAGMTGSLAVELAADNITVNCIVPGRVDTPRPAARAAALKDGDLPMGRPARQQEIADLVHYLCGDGCRYMSGQMLHVNGAHYVTIA